MKFGLTDKQVEEIKGILRKHPEIKSALVFGSRAMGNFKEASDVDIAIKGEGDASFAATIKGELEEDTYLPFFFDVVHYDSLNNPKLKKHIDNYGEVLYINGWSEHRFSDFVKINPRVALSRDKQHSYVEMRDIVPGFKLVYPSQTRPRQGGNSVFENMDTLFARITPCLENGKIAQVRGLLNDVGFGSTEFLVFRGIPNVSDTDFVYYLSTWNSVRDFAEASFDGTSGRQRVPAEAFNKLYLRLPSLETQKTIAFVLSALDEKIVLLQRQNTTLESLAETVFRQWFIEEAKPDWRTVKLTEILDVNPSRKLKKGETATYVDMGDLSASAYRPQGWIERPFTSGSKFINGDTLMARITPCLENGKTGFVDFLKDGQVAWGSTEFLVFHPKPPLPPFFAYVLSKNEDFRSYTIQNMTGSSGRQRVNPDCFAEYEFHLPSDQRIGEFAEFTASILPKMKHNSEAIQKLKSMRDSLLPKLMSGEIHVGEELSNVQG